MSHEKMEPTGTNISASKTKQVNKVGEKKQTNKESYSSSWLWRRIRQCSGSLVLCLSENNREMGRGVFLQVHCGHYPRMRCLICARPCCCACLWALDMCTAAWIIEASHAVRVRRALLASLSLSFSLFWLSLSLLFLSFFPSLTNSSLSHSSLRLFVLISFQL